MEIIMGSPSMGNQWGTGYIDILGEPSMDTYSHWWIFRKTTLLGLPSTWGCITGHWYFYGIELWWFPMVIFMGFLCELWGMSYGVMDILGSPSMHGHDSGTDSLEVPTIYKAYFFQAYVREYSHSLVFWHCLARSSFRTHDLKTW
jgi:hypothetical protein